MTAATQARKPTPRRVRGQYSSDTADAIERAAEDAKRDGKRTSIAEESRQKPKVASKEDVEQIAQELSPEFLHCRDFGHQWRMTAAKREGKIRTRTMFCPSCKYNKYQTFDSRGIMVEEKTDYPEGYLIKGLGRIVGDTKGIIRIASIDAAIEKSDAAAAKRAKR